MIFHTITSRKAISDNDWGLQDVIEADNKHHNYMSVTVLNFTHFQCLNPSRKVNNFKQEKKYEFTSTTYLWQGVFVLFVFFHFFRGGWWGGGGR